MQKAFCSVVNTNSGLYNSIKTSGKVNSKEITEEFLDALQKIKDNTDAIPLYTNYAAGWTMGVWDMYTGVSATADEKQAALIFVKWMAEDSGYSYNEDGLPVATKNTDTKLSFEGVEFVDDSPALEGEEDLLNELNSECELNVNNGGDRKIQEIIEHASIGDMTFDEIMDSWNELWTDAQESLGVEVLY